MFPFSINNFMISIFVTKTAVITGILRVLHQKAHCSQNKSDLFH
jgi:hypothetical protein